MHYVVQGTQDNRRGPRNIVIAPAKIIEAVRPEDAIREYAKEINRSRGGVPTDGSTIRFKAYRPEDYGYGNAGVVKEMTFTPPKYDTSHTGYVPIILETTVVQEKPTRRKRSGGGFSTRKGF